MKILYSKMVLKHGYINGFGKTKIGFARNKYMGLDTRWGLWGYSYGDKFFPNMIKVICRHRSGYIVADVCGSNWHFYISYYYLKRFYV